MRLFDQLLEIKDEHLISFHVPGHKYHEQVQKYFEQYDSVLQMDVTEFQGTDDLHDPEGAIRESQKAVSQLYHSKNSFYLVNGTTCGIYAMIMAVTEPGDEIIIARDCHRSVYDALILGHLNASFVDPVVHETLKIPLGLTVDAVKEIIEKTPYAKALVLTYPNYYGITCDLEAIVAYAHEKDIMVLVDEAHGAHLILDERLPQSAIHCGADITVQSAHKSLPVLTQASLLHLNSDQVDEEKLKFMLKLHQTSSPSYVLMTSLDIGIKILELEGKERMVSLLESIERVKILLPYFLKGSDLPAGFKLDPTKLVLKGITSNYEPIDVEKQLRKNGLQLEFSNENVAVFVSSIMNKKADFDYLIKMMEMLKFKCYSGIDNSALSLKLLPKMSVSEAIYAKGKSVLIEESIGKISKGYIVPYPPGIPAIIPGEMINEHIVKQINIWKESNLKIIGLKQKSNKDLKIEVVES